MSNHSKREYTPEEIDVMCHDLRNTDPAYLPDMANKAADMLESLASSRVAQKREGVSALPNAGRMMTMCCCGKLWESGSKPDCVCVNQPPSPDQDREVSP